VSELPYPPIPEGTPPGTCPDCGNEFSIPGLDIDYCVACNKRFVTLYGTKFYRSRGSARKGKGTRQTSMPTHSKAKTASYSTPPGLRLTESESIAHHDYEES